MTQPESKTQEGRRGLSTGAKSFTCGMYPLLVTGILLFLVSQAWIAWTYRRTTAPPTGRTGEPAQFIRDSSRRLGAADYGAGRGGPGGPLLVLVDETNPFGQYYAEILLTEGLNAFAVKDISGVSRSVLADYDVIVLSSIALTSSEAALLGDWVNEGGNLIAMRPDKKLAGLLGLVEEEGVLSEGCLIVDNSPGPGAGIAGQPMQFHGTADFYSLGSASSLAMLLSGAERTTSHPAVTLRTVGTKGGQAAAFAFDLAKSIVLTRQGNPAWAGQDRDGIPPLRANDLFYGGAPADPRQDWINLDKVAIPQADEQQRLLANMIIAMSSDRKPLPRFWYFPDGHKAVVVMTGDDHGNNGTRGRFDRYLSLSADDFGGAWGKVRSTSYVYPRPKHVMTNAEAAAFEDAGFEIGLHLNTGPASYTKESLDGLFRKQLYRWRALFPSLPPPVTHRAHCIAWSGYTIMPEVEARHGIRLDVNYYYYPPQWVADRPGFFTGSGMPMRFSTAGGDVIDVYQAATQMTDESGQSYPFTVNQLLDKALGPEGYFGAFVANMHTDTAGSPGSDEIIRASIERNVPVVSARQLLAWLDGRNSSSINDIRWESGRLAFRVRSGSPALGLQGMVPLPAGCGIEEFNFNGRSLEFHVKPVKGIEYAFFEALPGEYEAIIAPGFRSADSQ